MGKDQELLEAARNGNVPVVEKILSQRAKRSGPLASLRRGPGANVQDASGYSALHHAALNGHKQIVQLLLTHEASTNIADVKGSSPLHLAAWAGNVDIVRLLLNHGPSVPNVNLTTKDNETALHCAAQYGHTACVSELLEHCCDPTIRNARHETALDLAAQYGRLETVDLLVRTHPELVEPFTSRGSCSASPHPHTPLHLASRNGHKAVVELLLTAGMDVNVTAAGGVGGSALHEAALCGKVEVARLLLQAGVDLSLRDHHHHTVQDLLKQFPPHTAPHAINALISRHKAAISGGDLSDDELLRCDSSLPPIPVPSLGSPYENVRMPPGGGPLNHSPTHWHRRVSASSAISIISDNNNSGLSKSLLDSSYLSGNELCPRNHRDLDQMSVSSTASSTGPSPSPSPRDIYLPMTPTGGSKISPTPPKKPPRRNLSVSPTHLTPLMSVSIDGGGGHQGGGGGGGSGGGGSGAAYEYLFMARSGVRSHGDLDELQAAAAGGKQLRRGKSADQYVDMKLRRSVVIDDIEFTAKTPDDPKYQPVAITSLYENVPFRTTNPRRKLRRIGHDRGFENCDPSIILSRGDLPFRKVDPLSPATASNNEQATFISNAYITLKSSTESLLNGGGEVRRGSCPLSPTHYQQPPTPDHPPPSAMQAERSIHERIRPLSQEYCNIMKRRSRDIETETDEELLLLVFPAQNHHATSSSSTTHCHNDVSSGSVSLSSSVSLSDKSVSTDNNAVEEFVGDAPFAGLMKGSVSESISSHATTGGGKAERPKTLRGRLRNVFYEPKEESTSSTSSASVTASSAASAALAAAASSTTTSASGDKTLAILSPFDEQEEWAKISEIMASFGTGLVRESVFVTELEKEFQARLGLSRSESTVDSPIGQSTTVNQWLASLGLSDYESLFINYGFDNPDFINGVLEESDLKEMGIGSDKDRKTLLDAARTLPCKVRDAFVAVATLRMNNNNNNNHVIKDGGSCEKEKSVEAAGEESVPANEDQQQPGGEGSGGGDVDEWLRKLQLEEYCETFRRHLYTEMEKVSRIWEVELTAVLEIDRPGHRKRILASLPQTKERCPTLPAGFAKSQTAVPNIDDINADLSQLKNNIQQLKEEIRVKLPQQQSTATGGGGSGGGQQSNTGTLRHSHKKSRPAPPPPPGAVAASAASDLEIRAPSELLVGVPATLTAQWRHRPHALLAGHITYIALYLGSTLVRDMRGTESTKKSIQKLKKSTPGNEEKSIPEIILAISYRGVKFLHTSNQELICEHEIRNIHCACQDAEDLTHFAYITKDHASKSHYCHVFCVQTMDQATEVILTLGQAFEVAYQMALRENLASNRSQLGKQVAVNTSNGHTRSRSVNQIVSQNSPGTVTSSSPQANHSRSHSVNEIKVNGTTATSSPQRYQETGGHPLTPSSVVGTPGRAPIVMSEDI